MENLTKQLRNLIDNSRSSMEVAHILELVTYVAFIAKENSESFEVIVNSGHAKQLDMLIEAGKTLEGNYPTEICSAPDQYRIDVKMINLVVSFIAAISSFDTLAKALREMNAQVLGRFSADSANLNMERIFSALVGECSGKSVYDGACGLARVASSLNSEALYLEEKNHSTYVTAYRLLTLESKHFKLVNTDSLLESSLELEKQFDLVVMEPPMAQKFGADERRMLVESPFIQVPTGSAVSAAAGDSLWIQQVLSKLNETGKGYILIPQGFLFRGGYDAKVREHLLENELLEANNVDINFLK